MKRPRPFAALLLCGVLASLRGCGSDEEGSPTATGPDGKPAAQRAASGSLPLPPEVDKDGALTFCSDISYPPEEFYNGTVPAGSDIDIGEELARMMGVQVRWVNTPFDDIIKALKDGKCHAIISGMSDTPERRKQVNFINYLSVGSSLMVTQANEGRLTSMDDLAGLKVSVEKGTTNADWLHEQAAVQKKNKLKPLQVVEFSEDNDAVSALKDGRAHAYLADSPVVAHYIGQNPGVFVFALQPINPGPIGIAVRKDDLGLYESIGEGIDIMYKNGTIHEIMTRWKLEDFELSRGPEPPRSG